MLKTIDVFECPTNFGLREQRGKEPMVKFFPQHLKKYGFYDKLMINQIYSLLPTDYEMIFDPETSILNVEQVTSYAIRQAELLESKWQADTFKLIIGGDCSLLLGTGMALKRQGRYGLIYLDGHTDYCSVETTDTKAVAGMDLGLATGFGPDKLVNLNNQAPYFDEENIFCVGDKESDPEYVRLIEASKINYFDLGQIRKMGSETVARIFLQMVEKQNLTGFFVHLDVDILTSLVMPAVDCPDERGLTYEELMPLLKIIMESPLAVGMELTIFDPSLDTDGVIIKRFIEEISILFR